MAKRAIATKVNLKFKFFTALVRDYDEEALHMFKSAYLDPTGIQISKPKSFVDSGEW